MDKKKKGLRIFLYAVIFLLSVSLLLHVKSTNAQYICAQNQLRVALALNDASGEFTISQGEFDLIDYLTQKTIGSGNASGTWRVIPVGSQNIQLSSNTAVIEGLSSSMILLRPKNDDQLSLFRYKGKSYRGSLLITNVNGVLHFINVVDLEQYLYSVVISEMGTGAHIEAYKAQAVVSRTYAIYYKQNPQLYYDVGITQQWQVYGGYESEIAGGPSVRQAVDETKGLAVYYDDEVIQAFFHSNSGGYTESSENVWYADLPYIRPMYTPEDKHALEVQQSGEWPAISYQWEKSFTKSELSEHIRQWNSNNPQEKVEVGEIADIRTQRYAIDPETRQSLGQETKSGRVTQLDFIGIGGSIKSFFRDRIRSVLGLRSTLFKVQFDSEISILDAYNSVTTISQAIDIKAITVDGTIEGLNGSSPEYYVLSGSTLQKVPKKYSKVIFTGKGYGHGLGMSQWGARGMALSGKGYREIIEHFYNQNYYDGRLTVKLCV